MVEKRGFISFLSEKSGYSEEVLLFCIKLWGSTILQSLCMLIIGCIFFDIWYFISFFATFVVMRTMIEGYHCKTFKGCFALSLFIFVLLGFLTKLTVYYTKAVYIGLIILSVSTLYLFYVCAGKEYRKKIAGKRDKIYYFLRLAVIALTSFFIIINVLIDFEYNSQIYMMLYSYIMIFILTIFREEET